MFRNVKYVYPDISEPIRFLPGKVCSLVIENQDLLRSVAEDFHVQFSGSEGKGVLSDDNSILRTDKYMEVISGYVPFEINRKPLLSKLYAALEKTALDAEHYIATQELLVLIEKSIYEWAYNTDCDLSCDNISVSSVIKASGVVFSEDKTDTLGKIIDYMENVRQLDCEKIFVFFLLRSYFSDRKVKLFLKNVLDKDFTVLLIDNVEQTKFDFEARLTVDKDLCLI